MFVGSDNLSIFDFDLWQSIKLTKGGSDYRIRSWCASSILQKLMKTRDI